MYRQLQILPFLCFFFITNAHSVPLKKCCGEDEGIIKTTSNTSYTYYQCTEVLMNNDTLLLNNTLDPLRSGKADQVFIYGFPENCSNEFFIESNFSQNKKVPNEYCIDKVLIEVNGIGIPQIGDGSVIVLTCPGKDFVMSDVVFNMTTVNKCCLENMVYDTTNHMCVNRQPLDLSDIKRNVSRKGLFEEFIEGESSLLNVRYGLSCLSPKVAYEYKSDDFEFELKEDILKVNRSEKKYDYKPGDFCLDETTTRSLVARGCRSGCSGGPCVSKCCPPGHVYGYASSNCTDKPSCIPSTDWGLQFEFHDVSDIHSPRLVPTPDTVGIRFTIMCPQGKYPLVASTPEDLSYLDVVNGDLVIPGSPEPRPNYCIETFDSKCEKSVKNFRFVCFPPPTDNAKIQQKLQKYSVGLAISSVFLGITLFVYIALPPLQNLHGKTIMCHVASMLVAFSCLARAQWSPVPHEYCRILGFVIYFSFLSAFSWLNIMCFDIWWTFANIRTVQMMRRDKDWIKFFKYSLYAWGVPTVLTIFTYLVDIYNVLPGWLDPNIGASQCWITTSTYKAPETFLFILPVGIQTSADLIFFILTARYCNKVRSEIHRMQAGSMGERCRRRFTADKAKYAMNMKLFVVMGMSWIFEVISHFGKIPTEFWYIADAVNALQGIPIFCILVLKWKIFHLMKKRMGIDKIQQRPKSDLTMSTGLSNSTTETRKSIPTRSSITDTRNSSGTLLPKSTNKIN